MTADAIERLRRHRAPIVYDAIEHFGVRAGSEGYTDASIRALLPALGAFAGYACTGRMADTEESPSSAKVAWREVCSYVEGRPGPKIMVCRDVDPVPRGRAWGDVSASILRRLGCSAVGDGLLWQSEILLGIERPVLYLNAMINVCENRKAAQ